MRKSQKIITTLLLTIFFSAAGYVGELPDLSKKFEHKKKKNIIKDVSIEELLPFEVNETPPNYQQTLLKNTQYSSYLKDMDEIIPIVEQIRDCIKQKRGLQEFSSISNILHLYVKAFKEKYNSKNESHFESYKALTNLTANIELFKDYWVYSDQKMKYVSNFQTAGLNSEDAINEKLERLLLITEDTLGILEESVE